MAEVTVVPPIDSILPPVSVEFVCIVLSVIFIAVVRSDLSTGQRYSYEVFSVTVGSHSACSVTPLRDVLAVPPYDASCFILAASCNSPCSLL